MPRPLFILASASPRRLALLSDIGVVPDSVLPAALDESPRPHEQPRALARRLALEKMHSVAAQKPDAVVLAADTVIAVGRRILPKAETAQEVGDCLRLLSGRRHRVLTGVAMRTPEGKILQRLGESVVLFQRLSPHDIDAYVASGEGLGKAGGYAIQGRAAAHIRFISGSYSNIVGLPLFDVAHMLQAGGVMP